MRPCGRLGEVGGGWGGWWRWVHVLAAVCIATTSTTCTTSPNLHAPPARYEPAHDLGQLFHDVQLSGMFEDSKTFADARPRLAPAEITAPSGPPPAPPRFNLRQSGEEHFDWPRPAAKAFRPAPPQPPKRTI